MMAAWIITAAAIVAVIFYWLGRADGFREGSKFNMGLVVELLDGRDPLTTLIMARSILQTFKERVQERPR